VAAGGWLHCADLTGTPGGRSQSVKLAYAPDFAISHFLARDHRALTVRLPVDLGTRELPSWPAFLMDLLPQGAARRRLERDVASGLTEWDLLERGAFNPAGNLRIIPSEPLPPPRHRPFDLQEMVDRGDEFIEHAARTGATVAGATDTQGEAPKFWVVCDADGRWYPDDGRCDDFAFDHALLKFPVPEAGQHAQLMLLHEALYQLVARHMGLRVTSELPQFIDGALLVPRFDRRVRGNSIERLGVESLYSIAGIIDSAQGTLRHDQILIELSRTLTDFEGELQEYVRRDLFNLAVGNRDNHGRNTAVLKDVDGSLRLAPLFDVGPAFLDARAIARVIRWDGEPPGGYDWVGVHDRLAIRFEEADAKIDMSAVTRCMRDFADELPKLPDIMQACGVDAMVIERRRPDIERLARSLIDLPRTQ
jgi:serine/threonine-protein kinase HipA